MRSNIALSIFCAFIGWMTTSALVGLDPLMNQNDQQFSIIEAQQ